MYSEALVETINCKEMTCPQPVIETRNYLSSHPQLAEVTVLVDNLAAAQNVERFLGTLGFQALIQGAEPDFAIQARKQGSGGCQVLNPKAGIEPSKTLIMIGQDRLGQGDEKLGQLLMLNFIRTLKEMSDTLWRLVFVNSGVKLAIEGAEALPALQELESQGISILVCGTCLNHFGLLEKKQCGQTTNMLDIVTSLQVADKVITY